MARRRSSLGFLGLFGRSSDLRELDGALRAVNLMKDHWPDEPPVSAYAPIAQLFGYCIADADAFADANGGDMTQRVEHRIEAALEAEESFDAQIILLALHAKLINPDVVERFGLSAG